VGEFLEHWKVKHNKPALELNIEGYPDKDFLRHVTASPCHQVTLVPDAPGQRTSDHGWDITAHKDFLTGVIAQLHAFGRRVSVFIDPDPRAAEAAAAVGADRVELYTGPYGYAWEADDFGNILHDYTEAAETAKSCGLGINAGHDLNLANLKTFLEHVPECAEVSIGHAITDDALKMGWAGAVEAYLDITRAAARLQKAS
jgi:pyridoxine 5-phosphate synthase